MLRSGVTPGPDPKPLTAEAYARCLGLVFQGSSTVARLLRTRVALCPRNDGFQKTIDAALDELGAQWGIQL